MLAGYGLSSLVRPLIAFVTSWPQVLVLRFTDRLGKGIRTSPRDAMLARLRRRTARPHLRLPSRDGSCRRRRRPALASAYLYFHPEAYRSLFTWTLVPGIIVILILLRVPEQRTRPAPLTLPAPTSRGRVPSRFYLAIAVILFFSLGNASDAFILLRLSDLGVASGVDPAAVVRPARREDDLVGPRRRAVGSVRTPTMIALG